MNKILINKIKESFQSILPMSVIILIICFILDVPRNDIMEFIFGALMLIVGLILFSIGAVASMMTIAEEIGGYITKKSKLFLLIFIAFIIGFIITLAEPSLWVLSDQFSSVSSITFILSIAVGIGVFLVLALLRIVFQLKLSTILIVSYLLLFLLACFVPTEFIPVAFDSGGVTTGPMAVPFIIAIGLGVSTVRGDSKSEEDSFGLIGICSIGPIIAVFILGLFNSSASSSQPVDLSFGDYFGKYLIEVAIAMLPFILFFIIFHFFAMRFSKKQVVRVLIGFVFTYLGLVLFMVGASAGFISIGMFLGKAIASLEFYWLLIPLGMLFGFTIVMAEPAVIVLNKLVEDVSGGTISRKFMMMSMGIGVSIAIGLACLRILTGISIWWILIPGYAIALGLTFIVPRMFVAIAFDSGGAVSGALTSTFLVPYALGAANIIYNEPLDILKNAFGLVAFVAMAPLVAIQVLGLIYHVKTSKQKYIVEEDEIIELSEA